MKDTPTKQTLADALGTLAGHELSSVTFVRDYVQLGFDGPGVNACTMPTVTSGSESLSLVSISLQDGDYRGPEALEFRLDQDLNRIV